MEECNCIRSTIEKGIKRLLLAENGDEQSKRPMMLSKNDYLTAATEEVGEVCNLHFTCQRLPEKSKSRQRNYHGG